jgi:hypothetical protein
LLCPVAVAGALRLVPVVFVPSFNWGDEIFQAIEPAHRLVEAVPYRPRPAASGVA